MEDNPDTSLKEKISSLVAGIKFTIKSFSQKERSVFFVFVWILTISFIGILWNVNNYFLESVPAPGGSLSEGVIGAPRFINPLLAVSDADRDLTSLVYSGLMRATPDGNLIPDIAKSYEISEDGLSYTFTIREDAEFHDGKPITSDDVEFTITKALDAIIKSPKRASWEGISIEKLNEQQIKFTLKQPYSPFLANTTLGILPKHIWGKVEPEQFGFSKFNIEAIGSGPYEIANIKKNSSGIPEYYKLEAFSHFTLSNPYIKKLTLRFYPNEEAMLKAHQTKEVESIHAIPPKVATELKAKGARVETASLPRVFGIFFNQNQATIFTDKSVRQALNISLDKQRIIDEVLFGYGTVLDGPIPPGSIGYSPPSKKITILSEITDSEDTISTTTPETPSLSKNATEAIAILEKNGWIPNKEDGVMEKKTKKGTLRLEFSISTSDTGELKHAAEIIKEEWKNIGAKVNLKIFEIGDLNQNIIRPREYDALFFGEIIGRDSDPFAFWHSSQRLDPGLNIALYANITADALLEEARATSDAEARNEKYKKFEEEVKNDTPAVFAYSPDFIYIVPEKIKGFNVGSITIPSDRFLDIHNWYIETNSVWKIFNN